MESSTIENTDQDISAADDLVADQLVGDMKEQTMQLEEGEGRVCAKRELQHGFVDELQR